MKYPFNVISSQVADLFTKSERHQITQNEIAYTKYCYQNTIKPNTFCIKSSEHLIAHTRISTLRSQYKIIQIYNHNYQDDIHGMDLLQELMLQVRDFYHTEDWVCIHINMPVGFQVYQIDPLFAHIHCRYFLGRAQYFDMKLPNNYTLRIPTHSFDLVDAFQEMYYKFKMLHPYAEAWENTLQFDHWLNIGKCAVIFDAKKHPVAGIFMTYMKAFIFHYPTWQIQFLITDIAHQNQGLAQILRRFASNLIFSSENRHTLIGGIVGLWNTPSIKNISKSGRFACLDRVLIDRNQEIGYPKSNLNLVQNTTHRAP